MLTFYDFVKILPIILHRHASMCSECSCIFVDIFTCNKYNHETPEPSHYTYLHFDLVFFAKTLIST